jgi:16S rRNA processing protein RimM
MPDPESASDSERIAVGRINSPWGLKGHVRVTPLTSNPDRLNAGSVLLVRGERRAVIEQISPKGYPMLLIEGYEDRTAAETLRGEVLEIPATELPVLPDGEYYVDDLVGLAVITSAGDSIGTLREVLSTGANDVYVIARRDRRDALIPAIPDVVLKVDLEQQIMTIDPLPGLLDG